MRQSGIYELHVFRNDPKDFPTPINIDKYFLYNELPISSNELVETANSADTDIDTNFQSYLKDNIFLIRQEKDDCHWLEKLPNDVIALLVKKPGNFNYRNIFLGSS